MKKRPILLTIAYGLLALLAVSSLLIAFAKKTGNSEPSIGSFGPSGMRLFATLLEEAGYEVSATRDPTPSLEPGRDVPVAIRLFSSSYDFDKVAIAMEERVDEFAKKGGIVIVGSMARDFGAATRSVRAETIRSPYTDEKATFSYDPTSFWSPNWISTEPKTSEFWIVAGSEVVTVTTVGLGRGLCLHDFTAASNRFIDRDDNSSVIIDSVRSVVPKGRRIVFLEASWGNASEPGFFEVLGSWAAAGWNQALILGLVVVYTLGRPFGLPEAKRPRQSGQRELVDAYGILLQRATASDIAMQAVCEDADKRIRKALKLDAGLDVEQRNKYLPPELVDLLGQAERAVSASLPNDIATNLANKLDAAVSDFAGDRRVPARKRKKS